MTKTTFALGFLLLLSRLIYPQALNQEDELGRKQGKWLKTWPNGNTRYEGQFRDDRPFGTFTYFYQDGIREAVTRFSADGTIARTSLFYPDGGLRAEGRYIDQQRDSTWRFYRQEDGKMVAEEHYQSGKLEGTSTVYYPDTGIPAEVTDYSKGLKNGQERQYFPDGSLLSITTYSDDVLSGPFEAYYPNGQLQVKGVYREGMQSGEWTYFDEDGNKLTEEQFKVQPPVADSVERKGQGGYK